MKNFQRKNMKNSGVLFFVLFIVFFNSVIAGDGFYSGRSSAFENPFFAIGFNNKINNLIGYVSAIRTSPGNTDECKFMFKGKVSEVGGVPVDIIDIESKVDILKKRVARLSVVQGGYKLNVSKDNLPTDCDWILSFVGEPIVIEKDGGFEIKIEITDRGDWISMALISGKKTFFYSSPDEKSKQKSYLIPGDVVYVIEEYPGWLFVKYLRRKKITVGWIKQEDTQPF
ncbi:hypothetical protein ACLIKD_10205 [Azonexus sp. IMCC34842]|uniref:hypothetical protein n=1 Tax=Azonexus sp. IMCC34842 TaxID=3420950 RepID=UPI003D1462BC